MAVMTTRVASAEHVADNVIQLRLVKPEGFTWKTGEFARVGLKIEGDEVFRAYSIGSAPASETFILRTSRAVFSRRNSIRLKPATPF